MTRQEFEHAYFEFTVQHFSNYAIYVNKFWREGRNLSNNVPKIFNSVAYDPGTPKEAIPFSLSNGESAQ